MRSEAKIRHNQNWTKEMGRFTDKRNRKQEDFWHKTSRWIVDYCVQNNIDTVVCGKNKNWKQKSDMGKKNNQKFINIAHATGIFKISYKCQNAGIKFIEIEESYTSGTSFIDGEMPEKKFYDKSRRVYRGLFKADTGEYINADVNGAYQIMKKVFPDAFADGIDGYMKHPIIVNIE